MKILCAIPARAGSKGISGKNLRTVAGISLVGHAVLVAREVRRTLAAHECRIVLDTDGEEIAVEGRRWGAEVPFLRASELARDESPTIDCVLALLERLEERGDRFDAVILLQPTSPLRTASDVLSCWEPVERGAPSSISVTPLGHVVDLALTVDDTGTFDWLAGAAPGRRQDSREHSRPSGAVYVSKVESLRSHRTFIVPRETVAVACPPERSLDIDEPLDLKVAHALREPERSPGVRLAGRVIGADEPCFLIAEAGVNHNGDPELAHRLVDVAADVGADAVKFQTFEPEQIAAPDAPKAQYQKRTTGDHDSQIEMLKRLVLPLSVFAELQAHARERGITFLSTPFDRKSADALVELSVPALKVPSGEITNHGLIAHVARHGLPLLVSTGMSDMVDVADALAVIRENGDPPVALFHCVTSYPAEAADCNLAAMRNLRAAFAVPVGWSDHTAGSEIALAAVALGAELLEKHFTLDRALPGPDHQASLEPEELARLIRGVREVERSIGDGIKRPAQAEMPLALVARRSLHLANAMRAGAVLRAGDLIALRPGAGIPPSQLEEVVGRKLTTDLPRYALLMETHLR